MNSLDHIYLNLKYFKYLGMDFYKDQNAPCLRYFTYKRLFFVIFFGFFLPNFGQISCLLRIKKGNFIQEISELSNPGLYEFIVFTRFIYFWFKREDVIKLISMFNNLEFKFQKDVQRDIFQKSVRTCRMGQYVAIVSTTCAITVHMLLVPIIQGFAHLPMKMNFIFIDNEGQYFFFIYFIQILYKPLVVLGAVAVESFPTSCMMFAITQLDILINNFENINELIKEVKDGKGPGKNKPFETVLRHLIIHHSAIIRFVKKIENVFSFHFGMLFLTMGFNLCVSAIQLVLMESPKSNILSTTWILAFIINLLLIIYVVCYVGNAITERNARLVDAAFQSPWVCSATSLKRTLIIFMNRNQTPLVVTSATLMTVSISTFTRIIDWTYKGFAVMNGMKNKSS